MVAVLSEMAVVMSEIDAVIALVAVSNASSLTSRVFNFTAYEAVSKNSVMLSTFIFSWICVSFVLF